MISFLRPLSFIFCLSISINVHTQTIPCDAFCVTDIQINSAAPEVMNITIFFSSPDDQHVNYPFIPAVTNLNGDTIATGVVNFFAHLGNTSQIYEVNTTLGSLPDAFMAQVHFRFDTSECILIYPCTTSNIKPLTREKLQIYPNPISSEAMVVYSGQFNDLVFELYGIDGKPVHHTCEFRGNGIRIERGSLPSGMYVLILRNEKTFMTRPLVVID